MMWHWNSLWAPAPGDPPAVDDPVLWQSPWTAEQTLALQARTWEAALSAAHSWWTMLLSAWPMAPAALSAIPAWTLPHIQPAQSITAKSPTPRKAAASKRPAAKRGATHAKR